MNFFDHDDLGNHLLQLCPKVVKQSVYNKFFMKSTVFTQHILLANVQMFAVQRTFVPYLILISCKPDDGQVRPKHVASLTKH